MNKNFHKKGFTLVELLVSIGILSLIILSVSTFQKDVFSLNFSLQGSLNAQIDARHIVKVMVTELREASSSALGAYPIALASPTAITFYGDLNNDGQKDRIRYFLSGTDVKKGVTAPSGNPVVYNNANEKISTIVSGYVASSTMPLFQYFPSSYTGSTAPLSQPVDISSVRLVRTNVFIDKDPTHSPALIQVTSQVSLRNLKDNL